ncbi:MAG: alpha/beta-type small acid-soluble spore protein [Defluviitaleaceae bacterium]|nr:alpha/beta-type small acid-soluble spore protein [Defluviitaleaceae bacterium]
MEKTDHDTMKMEIAEELGLLEKVNTGGWKSLTAKESGRIGGILARRKKKRSEQNV